VNLFTQSFCQVSLRKAVLGILISLCLVGSVAPNASIADRVQYTATQIPNGRAARALNNVGQIVGMTGSSGETDDQAVVWYHRNELTQVAAPAARSNLSRRTVSKNTFSCAASVNDAGQVVGYLNGETTTLPFIWAPGGDLLELTLPSGYVGGRALRINTAGDVVGHVMSRGGVRGCVWSNGTDPLALDALPNDTYSRARGINDSSLVVGISGKGPARHAVLWTNGGTARDLGTLPGDVRSEANAINKNGDVVGISEGPSGVRAFLWNRRNGLQNLGALPGYENSEAYDINDSGTVVGSSNGPEGSRAFVWTPKGGMRDLNNYISPDVGVVLLRAYAINRKGQIIAWAVDRCPGDETGACQVSECPPAPKYSFLLTPATTQ